MSRDELTGVLRCAGGEKLHERHILCPFHDDTVKSAEIRQAPTTGRWYFYCHKCGIADDVWALQARVEGRDVGEILTEARAKHQPAAPRSANSGPLSSSNGQVPPIPGPAPNSQPAASHASAGPVYATIDDLLSDYRTRMPEMVVEEVNPYTDPGTRLPDIYAIRYRPHPSAKKAFLQVTPLADGWVAKGLPGNRQTPLFNRIGIAGADRILVVEGEKCVRAVTGLGLEKLAATTSLGGSKAARRCDWSPLAGKTVYLWADSDDVGRAYVNEVAGYLKELTPPCQLYRVREEELELPEHGDIADYIQENLDDPVTAVKLALLDAETLGASKSLADHLDLVEDGKFTLLEFINKPHLTNATQALLPGTVTIVAGEPEAAKSFFVLEEAWRQFEAGVDVRCMMLEDDHAFHLRRALAQMSGEADVLDHKFTQNNIAWVKRLFEQYRPRLDAFGAVLEADGSRERTLFEVADWVEKSAASGARLVIVDPITAASTGDMSWKDDRRFMMRAKFTAEKYGCSVLLVTHPKLGKAGAAGLSGLAGGASYSRFSQTVLWLKKHPELQIGAINDGFFTKEGEYLRTVHVHKARNGRDGDKTTSRTIAVRLNTSDLCFTELGMLM